MIVLPLRVLVLKIVTKLVTVLRPILMLGIVLMLVTLSGHTRDGACPKERVQARERAQARACNPLRPHS